MTRQVTKTRNSLSGITTSIQTLSKSLSVLPEQARPRFRALADEIAESANPERIIEFNRLVTAAGNQIAALGQLSGDARTRAVNNVLTQLQQDIRNIGNESDTTTAKVVAGINAQRRATLANIRLKEQEITQDRKASREGTVNIQRLRELNTLRYDAEVAAIRRIEAVEVQAGNADAARAKAKAAIQIAEARRDERSLELGNSRIQQNRLLAQSQVQLLNAQIAQATQDGDLELRNSLLLQRLELERSLAITQDEQLSTQQKLTQEQQRQNGSFLDGVISKYRELNATQTTVFELGQQGAQALTDRISGGFAQALASGEASLRNFGQVFGQVIEQAIQDLIQLIIRQLIYNAIVGAVSSAFGGGAASQAGTSIGTLFGGVIQRHGGGRVGETTGISRNVDPRIFTGAPKFHQGGVVGLRDDEQPAILQRGEVVQTERDARGSSDIETVSVNITNESGQQLQVSQSSSVRENKELIVDVFLESLALNTRGMRTAVQGATSGL